MWRFLLSLLGLWTGDAAVETAGVPGEAAPTTGDAGTETGDAGTPSIDDAGAASAARILGQDPDTLAPDGMPYRDAKDLREAQTKLNQEFGPLANLDPATRAGVVTLAPALPLVAADPSLAADVGLLQASFPQLDADDQQVVRDAMVNPTVEFIRQAAALLRGDDTTDDATADAGDGTPAHDAFGFALDDPDRPATQAEIAKIVADALANRDAEAGADAQRQQILDQVSNLGYSPQSADPYERAEAQMLIGIAAGLPNGSLEEADKLIKARHQQIIDQYASGKMTNVRPQLPGESASPSGERVLESMDDSKAAMTERLAAQGLLPRR